nr:Hsp20/alpha crystallin family protein [Spartinivicinus marinus]
MDETETEYKVTISVPEERDVEVNTELKDNFLTINGKVKSQQDNRQSRLFYTSQFSQSITLMEPVDHAKMKLDNKKHEVVVTIPKV